jgi:hypothetical protein
MPNYNHIPILRDVQLIMVELEQIASFFSWYHKDALGAGRVKKKAMQIYRWVSGIIQHKQNRKQWIESLVYAVNNFKCQIKLAKCQLMQGVVRSTACLPIYNRARL